MFSIEKLRALSNRDLKLNCKNLKTYLKHKNYSDLNGKILFEELKVIKKNLTIKSKSSFIILSSLKIFNYFPRVCIAHRIILIILI